MKTCHQLFTRFNTNKGWYHQQKVIKTPQHFSFFYFRIADVHQGHVQTFHRHVVSEHGVYRVYLSNGKNKWEWFHHISLETEVAYFQTTPWWCLILNEILKIPWLMIKFHMFTLLFWVSSPISQQQRTARPDAAPRLCERKTGEPHSRSEKKESGRMEGFMCCHVRQVRPANNREVSWSIRLATGL